MLGRALKVSVGLGLFLFAVSACGGLFGQAQTPPAQQQSDHTTVISTGDTGAFWILIVLLIVAAVGLVWYATTQRARADRADLEYRYLAAGYGPVPMLNGRPVVTSSGMDQQYQSDRMLGR